MKTMMMTLVTLTTLASSFASANIYCSVTEEGSTVGQFDKVLFKDEVKLGALQPAPFFSRGENAFYVQKSSDGTMVVMIMQPAQGTWSEIAAGNGKMVVLVSNRLKLGVGCVEADAMPLN